MTDEVLEKKNTSTMISMPPSMVVEIVAFAKANELSFSAAARFLIKSGLRSESFRKEIPA